MEKYFVYLNYFQSHSLTMIKVNWMIHNFLLKKYHCCLPWRPPDLWDHLWYWLWNSDALGCQKSGSGWVRVSLPQVWVRFWCHYLGFRSGLGFICWVLGFFWFSKNEKICLKFQLSSSILAPFKKKILRKN